MDSPFFFCKTCFFQEYFWKVHTCTDHNHKIFLYQIELISMPLPINILKPPCMPSSPQAQWSRYCDYLLFTGQEAEMPAAQGVTQPGKNSSTGRLVQILLFTSSLKIKKMEQRGRFLVQQLKCLMWMPTSFTEHVVGAQALPPPPSASESTSC